MRSSRQSKKGTEWSSAAAQRLLELAGDPPTVETAVRIVAGRLLEGVACPPTDLQAVGARLGVTEFYPVEMPISGELRRQDGSLKVAYSSDLPPTRQKFTIAHELGHAVFESTGRNCPRVGDELERLCNMIATEILMPREPFLAAIGRELTLPKFRELSRTFGTSPQSTALRCHELRRISFCEVDNGDLVWGYGVMGRHSRALEDEEIRWAIRRALLGESGDAIVFIRADRWSGQCRLEWAPIARGGRALVMAHPIGRART